MITIIGLREENLKTAEAFKEGNFWSKEKRDLFHPEFRMELPYAPPGWIQNMRPAESRTHLDWLDATVSGWGWEDGVLYATNYPDIFWIIRDGEGNLDWGRNKGHYKSRFLTRITVKDGKIIYVKDHFDNFLLYQALGIALPEFDYTGPDPENFPEWEPVPELTKYPAAMEENAQRALCTFVKVEFWEEGQYPIYTRDFVHGLPFTPENMPRYYQGREYDALNEWLQEHTHDWAVHEGTVLYETNVEGEYIIESAGNGNMTWSHSGGAVYQNRHVSWLKITDGYAKQYDEYFNPVNKFNSIGASVPTIPYLQGWKPEV